MLDKQQLEAIRSRDARFWAHNEVFDIREARAEIDRLRAYVDALVAAAEKVTCWECNDSGRMVNGLYAIPGEPDFIPCPYCAPIRDLRALLEKGL